jgi:hypothetical protein
VNSALAGDLVQRFLFLQDFFYHLGFEPGAIVFSHPAFDPLYFRRFYRLVFVGHYRLEHAGHCIQEDRPMKVDLLVQSFLLGSDAP